jgi:hypothetical protein
MRSDAGRILSDAARDQRRKAAKARWNAKKMRPASGPHAKSRTKPEATLPQTVSAPARKRSADARPLIATYCEAFKSRYGTNPVVDGKAVGLASNILRTVPLQRAQELVQAYLQMEDRWFLTKCHDFGTFVQNISKVSVALANGTQDPQERAYWNKVFKRGIGGSTHDGKPFQSTNRSDAADMGREALPSGTDGTLLGGIPGRTGECLRIGSEQPDCNPTPGANARGTIESGRNGPSAAELLADCGLRQLLEDDGGDGEKY